MNKIDLEVAYDKLTGSQYEKACADLAAQVLKDSNTQLNSVSGNLARTGRVSSDGKSITWDAPYARRVFYKSRQGSKHWFQQARVRNAKSWAKLMAEGMTK